MEKIPIRVVNQYTNSEPEDFTYVNKLQVTKTVPEYTDDEFLSCCDCTDNCADKSKCSCWRLTLDGSKIHQNYGYEYKRLEYQVETGIFECNKKCKCAETNKCLNRVVQKPIDHQLELFKTKDCGWGVRTLTDIPKCTFVCCYYGGKYQNNCKVKTNVDHS